MSRFRTHPVAALDAAQTGTRVRLAGRLVDAPPGGELLLEDGSGARRLRVTDAPGEAARAGDLICVTGVVAGDGSPGEPVALAEATVEVVHRARRPGAYPAPESEHARVRGRGRRLRNLFARDLALRAVRDFFHARGFVEIEAPLVVPSPGLEVHLDALGTADGSWLITSPEYQLKRLLAGGLERVFSLARCVRRGERGAHHQPEFTMLEWYRAWEGYERLMEDVEELVGTVANAILEADPTAAARRPALDSPWERITVREAMRRWAGIEIEGDEPVDVLRAKVALAARRRAGGVFDGAGHAPGGAAGGVPQVPAATEWDDVFFQVFLDCVEPHLGKERPAFLYEWPAPLGALARRKPDDPRVVERFEAYAGGLELCNAFGELCDPDEQRERFEGDLAARRRRRLPEYPVDGRFLGALDEGLPPSAGIALGVDRLVMLCLGEADIREVTAFTADEL